MLNEIKDKLFPFKFCCVRCGRCCTQMPRGVPLYYSDVENIAHMKGCAPKDFIKCFCELKLHKIINDGETMDIPVLYLKVSKKRCIFYEENSCMIHKVKPYICEAAPFVSLLFQDDNTVDFFKQKCKGFGHGTYYSRRRIRDIIKQEVKLEEAEWKLFSTGFYDNIVKPTRYERRENDSPAS
ncbi:MAG: YkgJ family cysteine cluster protein [Desulfomonilia bacterium]